MTQKQANTSVDSSFFFCVLHCICVRKYHLYWQYGDCELQGLHTGPNTTALIGCSALGRGRLNLKYYLLGKFAFSWFVYCVY